jgi:glycosyltransferase involved in cell wall biosynthesis
MQPFFSIIIPTKGRPDLIGKAIESVLSQKCTSFEIVIVDNNGPIDNNIKDVIAGFKDDRIKYFKTGGLSMADNWEYGFSKTVGKYMTVLADRRFYANEYVLGRIYNLIKTRKNDCISCRTCDVDNIIEGSSDIIEYKSKSLIEEFLNGNYRLLADRSPRGVRSFMSNTLYKYIIKKVKRICSPISPDYTMAFTQLWYCDKLLYSDEILTYNGGLDFSNGNLAKKSPHHIKSFLAEYGLRSEDCYQYTPLKVLSVKNSLYRDLFSLADNNGWDLKWQQVDMKGYLANTLVDIQMYKNTEFYEEYLEKWEDLLKKQPKKIRRQFLSATKNKNRVVDRIKQSVKKYISKKIINFVRRIQSYFSSSNHRIILVYQMGKGGSKSIFISLSKLSLPNKIYHVHYLTLNKPDSFKKVMEKHTKQYTEAVRRDTKKYLKGLYTYKKTSNLVYKFLKRGRQFYVVSMVRDPIEINMSGYFHSIDKRFNNVYERMEKGTLGINELILEFFKKVPHEHSLTWFDEEMKSVFDIDVYSSDFPKNKGYKIYKNRQVSLLVLKLEKMSECSARAFEEFLNIKNFKLVNANIAKTKRYAGIYKQFKESIEFPLSYIDKMYNSKFAQHFYTKEELDMFKKKWNVK